MHKRVEEAFAAWNASVGEVESCSDAVRRAFEAGFQSGERSLWERFGNPKYGQIKWNEVSE